jgi:hypothetical protein
MAASSQLAQEPPEVDAILRSGTNCVFLALDQEKIPAPLWGTSQGRALARPTKATCLGNPGNSNIQLIFPMIPYGRMLRQVKKSQKLKSSPRAV